MKVLVCGGRNYTDYLELGRVLSRLHEKTPIELLIHGGAWGADTLAGRWAKIHGVAVKVYPAEWNRHGKKAGPYRNQKMLDEEKPDLVVGFPGGAGTADMLRRARAAGIQVMEVKIP